MFFSANAALVGILSLGAFPPARVALLIDDPKVGAPTVAQIEMSLQEKGFEVVAPDVAAAIRKVVAPKDVLEARLPEGMSVLEADAIIGGAIEYSDPTAFENVLTGHVRITVRLIDLGSGKTTSTLQASGNGVGAAPAALFSRASKEAVNDLFDRARFTEALKTVGQTAGLVTVFVQGVPDRETFLELKRGLERAFAGAPVKELYFAKGFGKVILGGSLAPSLVGPDVADVISETKTLALTVDEVANTRLVTTFNRAKAVNVHALVLEPKVPANFRNFGDELGRFVATEIATFEFAKSSYQSGPISRDVAMKRAKVLKADVIVESEVLTGGAENALIIRVIDARTGAPILRQQMLLRDSSERLTVAKNLLSTIRKDLPEHIAKGQKTDEPRGTEPALATTKEEK